MRRDAPLATRGPGGFPRAEHPVAAWPDAGRDPPPGGARAGWPPIAPLLAPSRPNPHSREECGPNGRSEPAAWLPTWPPTKERPGNRRLYRPPNPDNRESTPARPPTSPPRPP